MRKCFLHIGTHKTGTTSIQLMLTRHAAALKNCGYLYPVSGRVGPPIDVPWTAIPEAAKEGNTEIAGAHHNIAWRICGDARFRSQNGTPAELFAEIQGSREHVILSSEEFETAVHFHRANFSTFVRSLQALDLQVIVVVYLRNPVDFVRSVYLEIIKHNIATTFRELTERALRDPFTTRLFDYDGMLSYLKSIRDAMIVPRSFDAAKNDVVQDFVSLLEIPEADFSVDPAIRANQEPSLARSFAAYYQARKGSALDPAEEAAIEAVFAALPEGKLEVSATARERLRRKFQPKTRKLLSEHNFPPFEYTNGAADGPVTMDNVFAPELPYFINDVARHLSRHYERLLAERDALAVHRDALAQSHHVVEAQRDQATLQRDALALSCEQLSAEREALAGRVADLTAQFDALGRSHRIVETQRDQALLQREGLIASAKQLQAERDALARLRDEILAERDALLGSRSWRLTAPLRRVVALFARGERSRS